MKLPLLRKLFLVFLFLPGILYAQAANSGVIPSSGIIRLIPGIPVNQQLAIPDDFNTVQRFRVTIPENAFAVRFEISGSPADLDLHLYQGDRSIFARAETDGFNEVLVLSHTSNPPIQPGAYILEVVYQWNRLPRWAGQIHREIPYTITMHILRPDPGAPLRPDQGGIGGTLSPENGMMQAFEVDVPRGAEALRFDLVGSGADVDLYIFRGGIGPNPGNAAYSAVTPGSVEWLVVDPVADATARYGVMILSQPDEVSSDFTLWISLGDEPPEELMIFPDLPEHLSGLSRASSATVELMDEYGGGSGVIIHPHGWVLTNYHVVQGSHETKSPIRVNLTLDPGFPPRELFLGEIVRTYPEGDLALVRITSGLYGQALPSGLRFPFLEVSDGSSLVIGSRLDVLGYPGIGALGSRSTITLSRGVVSGFEQRGQYRIMKSDALISPGSSGGATLDSQGRLVALATQIRFSRDGNSISFHHPLTMVPEQWWTLLDLEQPGEE